MNILSLSLIVELQEEKLNTAHVYIHTGLYEHTERYEIRLYNDLMQQY